MSFSHLSEQSPGLFPNRTLFNVTAIKVVLTKSFKNAIVTFPVLTIQLSFNYNSPKGTSGDKTELQGKT